MRSSLKPGSTKTGCLRKPYLSTLLDVALPLHFRPTKPDQVRDLGLISHPGLPRNISGVTSCTPVSSPQHRP